MVISNLNTGRILELLRFIESCLKDIERFVKEIASFIKAYQEKKK